MLDVLEKNFLSKYTSTSVMQINSLLLQQEEISYVACQLKWHNCRNNLPLPEAGSFGTTYLLEELEPVYEAFTHACSDPVLPLIIPYMQSTTFLQYPPAITALPWLIWHPIYTHEVQTFYSYLSIVLTLKKALSILLGSN